MKTQVKQKRRFLLILPLLILPFTTFGFWAMGGGKGTAQNGMVSDSGLNKKLPGAHNGDRPMDKLSYYEQAAADSIKRKEQGNLDPYYKGTAQGTGRSDLATDSNIPVPGGISGNIGIGYHDPNGDKVVERLAALQRAMNQPSAPSRYSNPPAVSGPTPGTVNPADVDRLEKMMKAMQAGNTEADPETAQLNGMLEKILEIQHPERVTDKIAANEQKRKGGVYPIDEPKKPNRVTTLEAPKDSGRAGVTSGFYGLDQIDKPKEEQNAISAVVHQSQVIVDGATVKLRLTSPVMVNGVTIPKDNYVFGLAQLAGERLTIKITSIAYKKSVFPVQLSVYDIDGLDGIYIPGAITRDVAKQSADQSIQSIGLNSFDPSLGAQAASAGIEAAKQLLSRKIKLIKVYVKAGYQVLLHDERQQDQ
ncbi:conjugative transposon protein TraM [Taibaiella koreensis]|uniref:conjugative transposon protein TraM n=1 Tax=Taibaiella koreensis TaxID=1268548 RepID=UPI000E59B4CB|nr:conjugative transposon protein TraM [Taibaiella koreensis]